MELRNFFTAKRKIPKREEEEVRSSQQPREDCFSEKNFPPLLRGQNKEREEEGKNFPSAALEIH